MYSFITIAALLATYLFVLTVTAIINILKPGSSLPPVVVKPPVVVVPPVTNPPSSPVPAPAPSFPSFTCNCYCPPIYYPVPTHAAMTSDDSLEDWTKAWYDRQDEKKQRPVDFSRHRSPGVILNDSNSESVS